MICYNSNHLFLNLTKHLCCLITNILKVLTHPVTPACFKRGLTLTLLFELIVQQNHIKYDGVPETTPTQWYVRRKHKLCPILVNVLYLHIKLFISLKRCTNEWMITRRMRIDIGDETHAATVSHLRGKGVIVPMTSQVVSLKYVLLYPQLRFHSMKL